MLFLNPHEAASYIKGIGESLPKDYFRVPIGRVLSLTMYFELDEATVFLRFFNRVITRKYIESTYDWR